MQQLILLGIFTGCTLLAGCHPSIQQGGVSSALHSKQQARSDTVYRVEDFPRLEPNPRFAVYERIHEDARTKIPWAVAMEQHHGDIDHFITHFGMDGGQPTTWNSEFYFGERYVFTLQVAVLIDYKQETIRVTGEPRFYLNEIRTVERDGSGTYGANIVFGETDFDKLVESDWDYTTIGVSIDPSPILRFQLAKAMAQSPRYPIQLLGN